jgi:hypothetical protein
VPELQFLQELEALAERGVAGAAAGPVTIEAINDHDRVRRRAT